MPNSIMDEHNGSSSGKTPRAGGSFARGSGRSAPGVPDLSSQEAFRAISGQKRTESRFGQGISSTKRARSTRTAAREALAERWSSVGRGLSVHLSCFGRNSASLRRQSGAQGLHRALTKRHFCANSGENGTEGLLRGRESTATASRRHSSREIILECSKAVRDSLRNHARSPRYRGRR